MNGLVWGGETLFTLCRGGSSGLFMGTRVHCALITDVYFTNRKIFFDVLANAQLGCAEVPFSAQYVFACGLGSWDLFLI
jgi:hypothetical protein